MASEVDITDFSKGENVQFSSAMLNRDQTPIDDAANVTVEFVISLSPTKDMLLKFDSSPQIILQDAPTGMYNFDFADTDFDILTAGKPYRYEIWTTSAAGVEIHQVEGSLILSPATGPD